TKSITGAPSFANSSHPLLRISSVGTCCRCRVSNASGLGPGAGWLPAENARNRPLAMPFTSPSAKMLRTELWEQTNNTFSGLCRTLALSSPALPDASSTALPAAGRVLGCSGHAAARDLGHRGFERFGAAARCTRRRCLIGTIDGYRIQRVKALPRDA